MSTLDLSAGLIALPQPKALDLSAGLSLKSQPTSQPSIDLSSGFMLKPSEAPKGGLSYTDDPLQSAFVSKKLGEILGKIPGVDSVLDWAQKNIAEPVTEVVKGTTEAIKDIPKVFTEPIEVPEKADLYTRSLVRAGESVKRPLRLAKDVMAPISAPFAMPGVSQVIDPFIQTVTNALKLSTPGARVSPEHANKSIDEILTTSGAVSTGNPEVDSFYDNIAPILTFGVGGVAGSPEAAAKLTSAMEQVKAKVRVSGPSLTRSFVEDPEAGVLRVGKGGLGKEPKAGINPEEVLASHESTGGATFHPKAGNLKSSDAWAVSAHPELTQEIKGRDLTEKDIKDYLKRPEVKDALARGDRSLGTWAPENENRHVLDVVKTTPNVREALRVGRLNGQEEIYHLGREEGMKVHDPADLEMRAKERFGLTKNPLEKAYLQPDGDRVRMEGSYDHRQIAELLGGEPDDSAIRNWGAQTGGIRIGTRIGRGGNEVYASFHPDHPITPEQLEEIRKTVGKLKNPNLYVEDSFGNKTSHKETVRVGDVHNIFEQAGAQFEHPFDTEVRRTGVAPPGFYLFTTPEKDAAMKLLGSLPPHDEYVEAAKAGAAMGGWWDRSGKALDILFGKDAPLVKNLLASQSPQQPVTQNLEMTLKTMEAWENAGRPTDIKGVTNVLSKVPGSGPDYITRFNNALRSLTGKAEISGMTRQPAEGSPIAGTKVSSMAANLNNFLNRVTLDSWIGLFGGAKEAKLGEMKAKQARPSVDYVAHSVAIANAAKALDILPAQAQEQIWSFTKTLTELAGEKKSFEEVLKVLNDHDVLRQAQDFSDMVLKNENIQSELKALGIDTGDPELQGRLRALSEERPKPGEGPVSGRRADPAILARIAKRLESTRREAGGASAVLRKKGEPEGGMFPEEGEAVPKAEEKHPLIQAAEEIHGSSDKLESGNAGWLSPEGKIFAQFDPQSVGAGSGAYQQGLGHARVRDVYSKVYSEKELEKLEAYEYRLGDFEPIVRDFANQTGAMRVAGADTDGLGIQVSKDHPPSAAQLQWLRRYINEVRPAWFSIDTTDLSKSQEKGAGVLPGDVDRLMSKIYGKEEVPFGKGLEEEKPAEGRQPGEEPTEAESLLSKAEKIFPPVPDPPERSFITPEGTYLSADENDHFAVSQLYDGLEDEAAIVQFLNDTGAVRTRFDGENFLVHLGDKEPTAAQMDSIIRAFREYEESVTSSIQIARHGENYPKDFSDKKLNPDARPIDIRRAIESVYEKKAEPVSLEAGFVPKPEEPVKSAEKADYKTEADRLGIEFRGVQEGVPGKVQDVAIFQDPKSGTSIGVRLDEWSPEKLQEHLDAARERMGVKAEGTGSKALLDEDGKIIGRAEEHEDVIRGIGLVDEKDFADDEQGKEEYTAALANKVSEMIDAGAIRLSGLGDPKDLVYIETSKNPNKAQRAAIGEMVRDQGGAVYDIRPGGDPSKLISGEVKTPGDLWRVMDKAFESSKISAKRAAIEEETAKPPTEIKEFPASSFLGKVEEMYSPGGRFRHESSVVNSAPPTETPKLVPEKIVGGKVSAPAPTYHEASSSEGNPWVRRSADPERSAAPENKDRLLMVQFSSELLAKGLPKDTGGDYYDKLYGGVRPGYARLRDFWEIPQWMGFVSHIFPDADVYVVRDMAEAKKFLNEAGYGRVAFSALDTNKAMIKDLAKGYKGKFDVGGYTAPGTFLDTPNVKFHDSVESMAKAAGVEYKEGTDYRHFEGSDVIPRLTMSDGCLHKCAFCVVEKKIDVTPEQVVNQQVDSISKLGAKLVYLNDKTFGQAPNYKQLSDLYARMKEKNPDFHGFIVQTTAAQMGKLPEDWLAKSGIKYVELGIESYNDPILKEMHKPATESLINKAVDKLRKNDIALIPNILIGLPGETAATYERTLQFLKDNADIISHANIYNLAIYENSELAKKITTASPGDFNENVLEKSFHSDPAVHQQFAGDLYGIAQDLLDKKPGEKPPEAKMPELTEALVSKYGTTTDPLKAGFLLSDGRMVPMARAMEHDDMLSEVDPRNRIPEGTEPVMSNFVRSEKAVRMRLDRTGNNTYFSIPPEGVSGEQAANMKKVAAEMGHETTVHIDVAGEVYPGTPYVRKEFASAADIDPLLRDLSKQIGSSSLGEKPGEGFVKRGLPLRTLESPVEVFRTAGPAKHEDFLSAVNNTPGAKVEGKTLSVDAVRYQTPEQAGERAVRTGVFFLPEKKSPYARYYRPLKGLQEGGGPGGYGGSMKVEGPLSIENPIVSRAPTGGSAPARAYDTLKGKGAYEKMRTDVLTNFNIPYEQTKKAKISKIAEVLKKYGGDPEMAEEIVSVSAKGNQLAYAIQEHIVASAVREAGHGGIVGYTKHKGQWRLSEIFDVTRKTYPIGLPFDFGKPEKEEPGIRRTKEPHRDFDVFDGDFGGWILSNGEHRSIEEEESEGRAPLETGHDLAAQRLGFKGQHEALEKGAIRVDLNQALGTMFEADKLDEATRRNLREAIPYVKGLPIELESWTPKHDYQKFSTKEEAENWLESFGARGILGLVPFVAAGIGGDDDNPNIQSIRNMDVKEMAQKLMQMVAGSRAKKASKSPASVSFSRRPSTEAMPAAQAALAGQ